MTNSPRFARRELYAQAYSKARNHHGDFNLEFTKFSIHLDTVIEKHLGLHPPRPLVVEHFQQLHINDLYLCAACAQSSEPAWHRFYLTYRNYIGDLARFLCPSLEVANDLAGGILADLFLPDRSGNSRIASYDGEYSLATWLRVIVTRKALNERERKWNHNETLNSSCDLADHTCLQQVEANERTGRYYKIIEASFKHASRILAAEEKLLLLWRYEDGLQAGQIAKINRVHPSTITRRLRDVQKKLYEEIVRLMINKHNLSDAAVRECITEILENPNYSILACIRMS